MEDRVTGFLSSLRNNNFADAEDMMMMLESADTAFQAMCNCLVKIHENGGVLDYETNPPPDYWAITRMSKEIRKVSHALKWMLVISRNP